MNNFPKVRAKSAEEMWRVPAARPQTQSNFGAFLRGFLLPRLFLCAGSAGRSMKRKTTSRAMRAVSAQSSVTMSSMNMRRSSTAAKGSAPKAESDGPAELDRGVVHRQSRDHHIGPTTYDGRSIVTNIVFKTSPDLHIIAGA